MAFKIKAPFHVEGSGQGDGSSTKGTSADKRTYNPFATKPKVEKEKEKSKPKPRKKVKAIEPAKARKINTGDTKALNKKDVLDSTPEISTKKPTVKAAPKDNSRKAIRQRKKADKAAGVSKSQMRANKAKSKSEAFMAKAKASKDPSMRAQLKRKSDRLAKRAARKGGSPVKAVTDPKDPKDTKNPKGKKKSKVIKVTQKITPSTKKKVSAKYDRFANYRNVPGAKPMRFRPDGSVTMMDKNGHTYGLKRPDPK